MRSSNLAKGDKTDHLRHSKSKHEENKNHKNDHHDSSQDMNVKQRRHKNVDEIDLRGKKKKSKKEEI